MNEERLKKIEAIVNDADMGAICSAVDNDGDCYESEREFTDNAAAYMRILIAEIRSLLDILRLLIFAVLLRLAEAVTVERDTPGWWRNREQK